MARPKNPNTVAATAATIRRGQESKAAALRQAGWLVLDPETVADPVSLAALVDLHMSGLIHHGDDQPCAACTVTRVVRRLAEMQPRPAR